MNSHYRLPTPGALPPLSYTDPVTVPAGDIADNPYWKRDVRRNYPRVSSVSQSDAVALLTVGSQAKPKDDVLQIGEAGGKQLVSVKQEGEEHGLAAYFAKDNKGVQSVLGPNGFPPMPCNLNSSATKYELDEDHGYPEKYVPMWRWVSLADIGKDIRAACSFNRVDPKGLVYKRRQIEVQIYFAIPAIAPVYRRYS